MRQSWQSVLLVLACIFSLSLILRLVGLNWDDFSKLHPDERFLTSITADIGDANNLTAAVRERCTDESRFYAYFDTPCSVLNPNNVAEGSFVYGTLPLFLVRGVGQTLADLTGNTAWERYDYLHYVGRAINALADSLTALLVFILGWRLFASRSVGLLGAALYACAVLPIQLAHFWTVDSLANFFLVLALIFGAEVALRGRGWAIPLFGVATGLTLASRINLAFMVALLPIALAFYLLPRWKSLPKHQWAGRLALMLLLCLLAGGLAFAVFRVFQPYAFTPNGNADWDSAAWTGNEPSWLPRVAETVSDGLSVTLNLELNPKWLRDVIEVSRLSTAYSEGWPPSNQWYNRLPYLYPWWNMSAWGMGLVLGATASLSLFWLAYQGAYKRRLYPPALFLALWVALLFGLQGGIHQMTLRYYLPAYGALCLLAAWGVATLPRRLHRYAASGLFMATLLWAFAFTAIYRQPLTRLEASRWLVSAYPATLTLEDENGQRMPANLEASDLRYPLTTFVRGETYLSEGFTLGEGEKLGRVRFAFAQTNPATVSLRLLNAEDIDAAAPLGEFTLTTDSAGVAESDFNLLLAEGGSYRWHVGATWEGGAAFYNALTTFTLIEKEGDERRLPLRFASPYEPVLYAHWTPEEGQVFKTIRPFRASYVLLPHVYDSDDDNMLSLRVGEERVTARLVTTGESHLLGASRRYALDAPLLFDPVFELEIRPSRPLFVTGTAIATEGAWDDHIPWSYCEDSITPSAWWQPVRTIRQCENVNPFGLGYYPMLELSMAEPDNFVKYIRMADVLQKADLLTLSSNRFYDALPRNPRRFPLSAEYYQRLFDEELGYTLARRFESPPNILGLPLRDQVLPTQNLPALANELEAEEAFTVYDHPTVFIFENRGFQPDFLPNNLVYDDDSNRIDLTRYGQSTFRYPTEPVNNVDVRLTLLWWGAGLWLIGWLGYPLLYVLLPFLPLRGFALSRGVAWLLISLVAWWLASVTGWPVFWSQAGLWALALAYIGLNLWLALRQWEGLAAYWRAHRCAFLGLEGLFLAAFALGILLRAVAPDLWHLARGGEKPMDFAYLNAVLRTDSFPPPNPWLAGYEINYYYFGFVLAALPIKLGNFAPEIGTNLVLSTLYAVVFVQVFTLAYGLQAWLAQQQAEKPPTPRRLILFSLLGTAFAMLMGNLATWELLFFPEPSMHPNRWYWYPTRVLGESANGGGGAINEVPFFSFLYGDLHAHILALLPTTLALAVIGALLTTRCPLWAYVLGAVSAVLYMSNTWDVLLYVPLGALCLLWAGEAWRDLPRFLRLSAWTVLGGVVTVAPFWWHFTLGEERGLMRWEGEGSLLLPFMLQWGLAFGVAALWLLYRAKALLVPEADSPVEIGLAILALVPVLALPPETGTKVACALVISASLLLAWRDKTWRLLHLALALIFAIILAPEYIVARGDVGRLNTVFKSSYQVWVWLGLLLPLLLAALWTYEKWRWQVRIGVLFLCLGLLYPIQALPARYADNETGVYTLNGNLFMNTLRVPHNGQALTISRDAALTQWMRANIKGFPVIAEWYEFEYQWNGRVSVQTGLPTVIGWTNHMRQQYTRHHPTIEQRRADIQTLYTSDDPAEIERIIKQYGVRYVVVGEMESLSANPDTLALFMEFVAAGRWRVAYEGTFSRVYEVLG
jgi:YYY domain-containing protein